MFDQLELPTELSKYLVSVTPILGINGTIDDHELYVITKYFYLGNNKLILSISDGSIPDNLSLNLLRKGEDRMLISAYKKEKLESKMLKDSKEIQSPFYVHAVVSFGAELSEKIDISINSKLAVYDIVQAIGVAGLDPSFNDDVTIAKTIEVMALTAVDTLVVERKLQN
jgi:hypothetical protein